MKKCSNRMRPNNHVNRTACKLREPEQKLRADLLHRFPCAPKKPLA